MVPYIQHAAFVQSSENQTSTEPNFRPIASIMPETQSRAQTTKFEGQAAERSTFIEPTPRLTAPVLEWAPINADRITGWQIVTKYEGVVISIEGDSFCARFTENASDFPQFEAEIPIKEIKSEQQDLLREGAFLTWMIGYWTGPDRVRRRMPELYIRRIVRHPGAQPASRIPTALESAG